MADNIPLIYRLATHQLYSRATSKIMLKIIEKTAFSFLNASKKTRFSNKSKKIISEKKLMIKAIINSLESVIKNRSLNKNISQAILNLWSAALNEKSDGSKEVLEFTQKYGQKPPWFLVISPGHACNLKCRDCYAGSEGDGGKLDWDILDKLINQAKKLWGIKLVVFSGGEPFTYRSKGKDILDMALKNPDLLFLVFTNGTLIDEKIAGKIAKCKNLTPAISVEGMQETTDKRRGNGIFDSVLKSMNLLRKEGVPFGISVTAGSENLEEILSDNFLDFFFKEMGVFYGFYFQYLPIGRNADFERMPNAGQRKAFFDEIWRVIEKKKLFLLDFWNHGTLVRGCVSAGRERGYLYIDWNGKVMPCVFAPFPAADINETFKNNKTINDVWEEPFFAEIRKWQKENGHGESEIIKKGNLLMPCPYRDHYSIFEKWIAKYNLSLPENTSEYLPGMNNYSKKMRDYGGELEKILNPIWEEEYFEK